MVGLFQACDSGERTVSPCPEGGDCDGFEAPKGSFRGLETVHGHVQVFTFGPSGSVVFERKDACVLERDSGQVRWEMLDTVRTMRITVLQTWGQDTAYRGRSCPALVPVSPSTPSPLADPFPFRLLEGSRAFEIQVSPIAWMRFDRI